MLKKLLMILAGVAVVNGVAAQSQPFNASLTPDRAVYNRSEQINGVTLSVWGENPQNGLALGFVNGSIEHSTGLTLGLLNYTENYTGVHWGVVNLAVDDFTGWQGGPLFGLLFSVLNYTGGNMTGLQIGGANYAGHLSGAQIGLVNYAQTADPGVQIGPLNLMPENVWFDQLPNELAPGMILVNWRF
jgi:hypothetical protein